MVIMHGCHSRNVALTNASTCITVIGEDAFGGNSPSSRLPAASGSEEMRLVATNGGWRANTRGVKTACYTTRAYAQDYEYDQQIIICKSHFDAFTMLQQNFYVYYTWHCR
jgi:hypothetical protein